MGRRLAMEGVRYVRWPFLAVRLIFHLGQTTAETDLAARGAALSVEPAAPSGYPAGDEYQSDGIFRARVSEALPGFWTRELRAESALLPGLAHRKPRGRIQRLLLGQPFRLSVTWRKHCERDADDCLDGTDW